MIAIPGDRLAAAERRLREGETRLARLEAIASAIELYDRAENRRRTEAALARFRVRVAETRQRVAALRAERTPPPARH